MLLAAPSGPTTSDRRYEVRHGIAGEPAIADDPWNDRPKDDPIQDLADRTEDLVATVRANKRELDDRITETTELLEESERLLRSVGEPDAK